MGWPPERLQHKDGSELGAKDSDHMRSPDRIDCVYLTCIRSDFSFLAIVLQYSGIRMHQAETLEETDFLLTVTAGTVLLSDVMFLDGSWREALRMAAAVHPHVASIVVAEEADHPSLSEAYSVGACAVLRKPFVFDEAIEWIRVLDGAARDRAALVGSPA